MPILTLTFKYFNFNWNTYQSNLDLAVQWPNFFIVVLKVNCEMNNFFVRNDSWRRFIFLKWNKRLDPLYILLDWTSRDTVIWPFQIIPIEKLGNPSSFSRSQTELGSILQMNKTKRNEGREKKLKFKSKYKNTFIFDWQNEKKSILYELWSESKVPKSTFNTVSPCKVSKNIPKWLEPRPNLYVCITYV